jgi:sRNA-binding protein
MAKSPEAENAQNTIAALADLWPQAFAIYEQRRRPLKLGIHNDVLAALNAAANPKEIAIALRWYCGNVGYLRKAQFFH